MLDHQPLTLLRHNLLHAHAYILCVLPLELSGQLDAAFDGGDARFEVLLAEFEGAVGEGHSVEVEEVEDFDCMG